MHREGFRCQEETTFDRESDRRSQPFSVRTQPHLSLASIHLIKWTWDNAHAASGGQDLSKAVNTLARLSVLREKSQNYCIETWASMTRYIKHVFAVLSKSSEHTPLPNQPLSSVGPTIFCIAVTSIMFRLFVSLAALTTVIACPQHEINQHSNTLNKRASGTQDWTYEASYNWGMINSSNRPSSPSLTGPH
jgi:hypothetical protein